MRIAIYARVSTDEQRNGRTIESQIGELERYAEGHGHVIVARYIDDGWTGSTLNRPALDRLRDEASVAAFDAVLVSDVDRLSRDVANLAVAKRDLERRGVTLLFQKLPNDNSPLGNFMVNILGSFAEFERTLIADRTRRGRRYKVQERGLIMGNLPPYGYSYVRKDRQGGVEGHYVVDEEEARVVRAMYSWVADEALSARAIVRRLDDLNIVARHGRRWARSSVRRVLTNETYMGTTYYYKHRIAATDAADLDAPNQGPRRRLRDRAEWVPIRLDPRLHIINRALFERAQARLRRNGMFSPRNVRRYYLLREVRKTCARCGAAYVGTPYHGRSYYRCSKRSYPTWCRARVLSARAVEPLVWDAVATAVQDPSVIIQQVTQLQKRIADEVARTSRDRDNLARALESVLREEERILTAYRTGAITLTQFESEIAKVNRRRSSTEAKLRDLDEQDAAAPAATTERDITEWVQAVRSKLGTFTEQDRQRFLGELLTEIVIADDHVRVRGEIPMQPGRSSHSTAGVQEPPGEAREGNVAHTPTGGRGRNAARVPAASSLGRSTTFRDTSGWSCARKPAKRRFEFELPLPPPRARAAA